MAIYGSYSGAIKKTYDNLTQVAASGSNISVVISAGIPAPANAGATYVVCVITANGNVNIEIGEAATATSFNLTGSDELICTLATDRVIGVWGVGGTPTVTIKRMITG